MLEHLLIWAAVLLGLVAMAGVASLTYLAIRQPPEGSRRRRAAVALASAVKPAAIAAAAAGVAALIGRKRPRLPRDALKQHVDAVAGSRTEMREAGRELTEALGDVDQAEDDAVAAVVVEDVPDGDLPAKARALDRALWEE